MLWQSLVVFDSRGRIFKVSNLTYLLLIIPCLRFPPGNARNYAGRPRRALVASSSPKPTLHAYHSRLRSWSFTCMHFIVYSRQLVVQRTQLIIAGRLQKLWFAEPWVLVAWKREIASQYLRVAHSKTGMWNEFLHSNNHVVWINYDCRRFAELELLRNMLHMAIDGS